MKKLFAIIDLYINISIYKMLCVFAGMAVSQVLVFYIFGKKYAVLGISNVLAFPAFKIIILAALVISMFVLISPFAGKSKINYRLSMLASNRSTVYIGNFCAKTILLLFFYFTETIILFLLFGLFMLTYGFTGGPQGFVAEIYRSNLLTNFFPLTHPYIIRLHLAHLIGTALICALISQVLHFRSTTEAKKKNGGDNNE